MQRLAALKGSLRSLEQILVAADFLSVPYGGLAETALLWLADAALCPVLPLGWQEWSSEERVQKKPYYQNVLTGETMWEHPQVAIFRGIASAVSSRLVETAEAAAEKPKPRPTGRINRMRATASTSNLFGSMISPTRQQQDKEAFEALKAQRDSEARQGAGSQDSLLMPRLSL